MTAAEGGDLPVVVHRQGATQVITINRPASRNALNVDVAEGLAVALAELEADESTSVAVLTGADDCFSSGLDLKELQSGGTGTSKKLKQLMRHGMAKPAIAAIEGYALAGGLELALMCDLIVASKQAKLGLPEVKRSLVANSGGLLRLPPRIGYPAAFEIALTGEPMTAGRLYDLGLVNRLVEPGKALQVALALASEIAESDPSVLTATKRILSLGDNTDDWRVQDAIADPFLESTDALAAARAFVDKRGADRATG